MHNVRRYTSKSFFDIQTLQQHNLKILKLCRSYIIPPLIHVTTLAIDDDLQSSKNNTNKYKKKCYIICRNKYKKNKLWDGSTKKANKQEEQDEGCRHPYEVTD